MTAHDETPRANVATLLRYQHEERMARITNPSGVESYELTRKSPVGKTAGFEFTIAHPDPAECARIARLWDAEFPAPQPIAKL